MVGMGFMHQTATLLPCDQSCERGLPPGNIPCQGATKSLYFCKSGQNLENLTQPDIGILQFLDSYHSLRHLSIKRM